MKRWKLLRNWKKVDDFYLFRVGTIIDLDIEGTDFEFVSNNHHLVIDAPITANRNSINVRQKMTARYSEGKVYSFRIRMFEKDQPTYQKRC